MRLLISAGGTGGGVYPALAVSKALQTADGRRPIAEKSSTVRHPPSAILWLGSRTGMEADLVPREGLPFKAIHAAGVHGVGWRRLPANAFSLVRGFFESLGIVRHFKPEALLVTGGFLAVPAALAKSAPVLAVPAVVAKLNVDENPETASRFGVLSIPTVILFENGEAQETVVGARPRKHFEQAWAPWLGLAAGTQRGP